MANVVEMWLVLSTLVTSLTYLSCNDLARGWGDKYNWVNLEEGLALSKSSQRPLMLVIHKSWCSACQRLGPLFAESEEIYEISKKMILVNVQDDEEPKEDQYVPDGGYIPRILFLDCNGNVRTDIYNEKGSKEYKYYYPEVDQIVESMRMAKTINCDPDKPIATDEL